VAAKWRRKRGTGVQTKFLNGTTLDDTALLVAGTPAGTTGRTGVEYVPASPINGPPSATCAIVACVPAYINGGKVKVYANSDTPQSQPLCVSWSTPCPP